MPPHIKGFFSFFWYSHIGNHPHEDLAKFGYMIGRTITFLVIMLFVELQEVTSVLKLANPIQNP